MTIAFHLGTVLYMDLDVKSKYLQGTCVGKGSVWAARACPNLHAVLCRVPWTPCLCFHLLCLRPTTATSGFLAALVATSCLAFSSHRKGGLGAGRTVQTRNQHGIPQANVPPYQM